MEESFYDPVTTGGGESQPLSHSRLQQRVLGLTLAAMGAGEVGDYKINPALPARSIPFTHGISLQVCRRNTILFSLINFLP